MDARETSNVPVQAVETTFDIIAGLQELDSAGITELATHLDRSKSTVHNHLRTLEGRGYVISEDGEYRLGLRFLDHGSFARARNPSYSVVEPKVRDLAEETGEICQFVVEEDGRGIVVFQERGEHAVETRTRVGTSVPLNGIPGGKAILAYLPDERVTGIVDEYGLPAVTEETITDRGKLEETFPRIREQGYAINREEHIKGMRAISVPIRTTEGTLLGAMNVAGPSYRLEEPNYQQDVTNQLLGVANELELNVTYSRF